VADRPAVAAIAASIKEWGWTTPALVGEDGGLIAGHARVLAARQLGIGPTESTATRTDTPPRRGQAARVRMLCRMPSSSLSLTGHAGRGAAGTAPFALAISRRHPRDARSDPTGVGGFLDS
jgi:hypothetical protein